MLPVGKNVSDCADYVAFRPDFIGAPGRVRTCGLWLRRPRKGGNRGQRGAAAPDFIGVLSNPRPR